MMRRGEVMAEEGLDASLYGWMDAWMEAALAPCIWKAGGGMRNRGLLSTIEYYAVGTE